MIDLLKGQEGKKRFIEESYYPPPGQKNNQNSQEEVSNFTKTKKEVDIRQYKDPEGLTVGKLQFGLWLAKNKRNFLYIFYGFLILIAAITWPLFIYTFSSYLIFGIKDDARLLNELGQSNGYALHTAVLNQKAQPLKYSQWQNLKIGPGKYDFVMKISNPNQRHAGYFDYYVTAGQEIYGRQRGYIFPGETKYLAVLGQEINNPGTARLVIPDVNWRRISGHTYTDWNDFYKERVDFAVFDKKFTPAQATILSEKLSLNELNFKITNNSAYSYWQVDLIILLRDRMDKIIGVNKYRLDNFLSGQMRQISVTWPGRLKPVKKIEIIPEVDILNKEVYKKVE